MFLLWLAQIVAVSAKHVHTGHMRRFDFAQQETNVQESLGEMLMNVNIDTLDVGDIQTGSGASDNNVLLIYTQRSHHGIS